MSGLTDKMQGDNFDAKQLSVLAAPAKTLLLRDYQASARRPGVEGPHVVLLQPPPRRRRRRAARHLRQPQRRRSRRSGPTSRISRGRDASTRRAKILALRLTMQLTPKNKLSVFWDEQPQCSGAAWTGDDGCIQQQGRLDLRRQPGQRLLRRRAELAGDRRLRQHAPEGPAGEVHRAGHQQAAARGRLRHLHLAVGLPGAAGQPDQGSGARAGAVGADLRPQRQPRRRPAAKAASRSAAT